jgi:hypothetical protein
MKALMVGLLLASLAESGACGALLPQAVTGPLDAGPRYEFVWDAAPEPAPAMIVRQVPEPPGWLMLLCGIGAMAAMRRRRPPLFS